MRRTRLGWHLLTEANARLNKRATKLNRKIRVLRSTMEEALIAYEEEWGSRCDGQHEGEGCVPCILLRGIRYAEGRVR